MLKLSFSKLAFPELFMLEAIYIEVLHIMFSGVLTWYGGMIIPSAGV